MNEEHRRILRKEHDLLSKVKLDDLKSLLIEYKIFNSYMWKDIKSTNDMLEMLPHRGPVAFQNIIEILKKANYFKEADQLERHTFATRSVDNNLYYVMSTTPLGFCLIINNVEFEKSKSENVADEQKEELEDRHGSDVDVVSLRKFFEEIGFHVTVETNKKASEMFACLKKFSKRDFKNVDSMIIIILSHGSVKNNRDFIRGTDYNIIYKSDICDIFNNKNCEELQNKPKIFFFICCRGEDFDYGVPIKCLPNESVDSSEIIMPSMSDMFVIHSTLPKHVSIRDYDKGTYFCEELIKVLKEHFRTLDLETMIKLVNSNLQKRVSKQFRIVQVAHVETLGGTKKIMLCKTLSKN